MDEQLEIAAQSYERYHDIKYTTGTEGEDGTPGERKGYTRAIPGGKQYIIYSISCHTTWSALVIPRVKIYNGHISVGTFLMGSADARLWYSGAMTPLLFRPGDYLSFHFLGLDVGAVATGVVHGQWVKP